MAPGKNKSERSGPGNRPKQYTLERAEQLSALVNPVRRQLYSLLSTSGPLSLQEMAKHLHRTRENIHYHVLALTKVELVWQCDSRETSRRDEALFDVVADHVLAPEDSDLEDADPGWARAKEKVARADFGLLLDRFVDGISNPEQKKCNPDPDHDYAVITARMTRGGLKKLNTAMKAVKRLLEEENAKGKGRVYQLGYLLTEIVEDQ